LVAVVTLDGGPPTVRGTSRATSDVVANKTKIDTRVGYLVLGELNPKLILCTDGDFHAPSMVGPGGYCAKVYRTEAGARRRWPNNTIRRYEV
jgi:hypothetical protein